MSEFTKGLALSNFYGRTVKKNILYILPPFSIYWGYLKIVLEVW